MRELLFNNTEYQIEEGSEIRVYDPTRMFGEWIKIYTEEYSVDCTNLKRDGEYTIFRIDKIEDIELESIPDEVLETVEEEIDNNTELEEAVLIEEETSDDEVVEVKNLSGMLKADLIDYALSLGKEVTPKMTKAQIIECINND